MTKGLYIILLVALLVRAAVAFYFPVYFRDSERYETLAVNLLHEHVYSASPAPPYTPEIQRTPLFPTFLALVYGLFGRSELAVRLANAILGTLSCLLIYRLSRRLFDEATALIAALLCSLYPFTIYYVGVVGMETFLALLMVVATCAFVRSFQDDRLGSFMLSGALVGLINLCRPFMLFFPFFFLGAIVLRYREGRAVGKRFLAFLIPLLLVAGPWYVRNYVLFGDPCLIGHGIGGLISAASREAEADGIEDAISAHNEDPDLLKFMHSDSYAEMREANEQLIAKSLVRLRENLGTFLLNIPKRIPRLWISSYHPGLPAWVLLFIRMAGVSVLLLGLYGIWCRRSEIKSYGPVLLFPAYITAMGAPLNTTARYTIPVRDLYLIFCAAALTFVFERIRRKGAEEAP